MRDQTFSGKAAAREAGKHRTAMKEWVGDTGEPVLMRGRCEKGERWLLLRWSWHMADPLLSTVLLKGHTLVTITNAPAIFFITALSLPSHLTMCKLLF